MTAEELSLTKRWVEIWKETGPELERIREEEVRNADTWLSIQAFKGLALMSLREWPAQPYSGLVEQQRWLQLLEANRKSNS